MRSLQIFLVAAAATMSGSVIAVPFVLSNGPGDGSLSVGVDGYGAFGSSVGSDSSDALYDPLGAATPAATTFESGVAIRIGAASGAREFLTSGDIGGSGGLANPVVSGTTTIANSTFSYDGLSFSLSQVLAPTLTGGSQTGSVLTQTYGITNLTQGAINFDLIRYIDGDLYFDGSLIDGGGRLILGGVEILFETDSATGAATPTTFVGISAEGGTIPTTGRYEIDSYSGLRGRIIAGTALDDLITGDGADADQFIDAGAGYDVTLALLNSYTLGAGATSQYITRTFFGAGTPGQVDPGGNNGIPEPASLALLGIGLMGLAAARRRKTA